MENLNTARIPFSVRLADGNYRGEAIGIGNLTDNSMFEVRLVNGSSFLVKAEPDRELRRYNWTTHATDYAHKLIPVIGRVIERYFTKVQ